MVDTKKDITLTWNGVQGVMHLEADLRAGDIQKVLRNVIHIDPKIGFTMDSVNYSEYIVQISQKIIKSAPQGFDINIPDNIRNLDIATWGELEDFISDFYPIMDFLERGLKVIFGKKYLKPNLTQAIEST